MARTARLRGNVEGMAGPLPPLRVALAQINSRVGDIEGNARKIREWIVRARDEGAELVLGGERHGERGYFHQPTVFTSVTNDMTIAQEEIFGPVLVVIPFDDDEDAIRIANDSAYGLAGNVMSGSLERSVATPRCVTPPSNIDRTEPRTPRSDPTSLPFAVTCLGTAK